MNKLLKAAVYAASVSTAALVGGFYGAIESGLAAHNSAKKALALAEERVEKSRQS